MQKTEHKYSLKILQDILNEDAAKGFETKETEEGAATETEATRNR